MKSVLQVALGSDENYLDGLVGTLNGVARRASADEVLAVVLDCGIAEESWREMEGVLRGRHPRLVLRRERTGAERLAVFNRARHEHRLNDTSYARLLLPELLPDLERVVYLDCDMLVDADLTPLMERDLGGAPWGAVAEQHIPKLGQNVEVERLSAEEAGWRAFNTGLLVLDLGAMRREGFLEQVLKLGEMGRWAYQDQALLNYIGRGRWHGLPARWNRQLFVTENFSIYRDRPESVWHFIGKMKPWHFVIGEARGLMADFQAEWAECGWVPRAKGRWRPKSPAWRDGVKATRAAALRAARSVRAGEGA
jgi:lipopolysaccharide biosynthesis glycosyltransferase